MHSEDQATHKCMAALAEAVGGHEKRVASHERADYEWEVARNTVTFAFAAAADRDRFHQDCVTALGARGFLEVARSDAGS
jgi:hypothetical protein